MKKILLLLMACMFMSVGMQAQNPTGISLDHDTIVLNIDCDTLLTATIYPAEASDQSVTWWTDPAITTLISIDTIATTDKLTCIIKGGSEEGIVKVIVEANTGAFKDTCVIKMVVPITSMELSEHTMTMTVDKDSFLVARITPFEPTNSSIIWKSHDPSIVNIISTEENENDTVCNISALNTGSVYIVAETVDGGFKDSCLVTVNSVPIETFSLSHDSITFVIGSDTSIVAHITPLIGTDKTITWKSLNNPSNSIIQRVSEGYDTVSVIRAIGVGEAKIVAETVSGEKDTCVFTVKGVRLESMTLDHDTIILDTKHNTDSVLRAIITPVNTTNDSIIWSTDNSSIVELDTIGSGRPYDTSCKIKMVAAGETFIVAVAVDSIGLEQYRDTCYVSVIVPVDSIVLSAKNVDGVRIDEIVDGVKIINLDLVDDSIARVAAAVWPNTAAESTYEPLVWGKLDPYLTKGSLIANDTLQITALRSGVDTIYVTTADGTISSDTIFVHIAERKVDSVGFVVNDNPVMDTIQLRVNESLKLATTIYPWNATSDSLTLTSSNTEILKVDSTSNGVFIHGLKEGVAVVHSLAVDFGERKDSCIVKVSSVPVTGMSLNKDTVYIYENRMDSVFATITPANATDRTVTWAISDNQVISRVSSTDSTYTFKGLKADTAVIRAEINGFKDSLVVIVKEQLVVIEADTTATNNGIIEFSLSIPTDVTFAGSFELQLPKGFGLTKAEEGYATALTDAFKESLDLTITRLTDSTYVFELDSIAESTTSSSMLRSGTMTKIMDIAYTIYDNDLDGSDAIYTIKFKDVLFGFSDETEINENQVNIEVKAYKSPTSNEIVDGQNASSAYLMNGNLYVNSDKAETVYVYSLNGSLIFTGKKTDGQAVFNVNTQEKILIVKGSSGWVSKVANR